MFPSHPNSGRPPRRRPWAIWLFAAILLAGCGPQTPPREAAQPSPGTDPDTRKTILFLGDSLTAGYGIDPELAYPALLQRTLDEAGLPYQTVNAGVSGDTTADGLNRLDWLLRQPVDVLVLALGANDALRGKPLDLIEENLSGILRTTRARYPDTPLVLAGVRMPVNYGAVYTGGFARVYREVAEAFDATLLPDLLDGVAGDPDLNLPDGIHPTPEGHRLLAETVWTTLHPLLDKEPTP